jgi:hypothetical protein
MRVFNLLLNCPAQNAVQARREKTSFISTAVKGNSTSRAAPNLYDTTANRRYFAYSMALVSRIRFTFI